MVERHVTKINILGWVTTCLLILTNIVVVARWTANMEQRMATVEANQIRIEQQASQGQAELKQQASRIEGYLIQHLQATQGK